MKRKAFETWTEVKLPLATILYGILEELLRILSGHVTLQPGNLLTKMYTAGTLHVYDNEEVIQTIQLTAEVMKGHFARLVHLRHMSPLQMLKKEERACPMAEHRSFLQTGSPWL